MVLHTMELLTCRNLPTVLLLHVLVILLALQFARGVLGKEASSSNDLQNPELQQASARYLTETTKREYHISTEGLSTLMHRSLRRRRQHTPQHHLERRRKLRRTPPDFQRLRRDAKAVLLVLPKLSPKTQE